MHDLNVELARISGCSRNIRTSANGPVKVNSEYLVLVLQDILYYEYNVMAVQACWEVNKDNLRREIGGLKNAMAETGIESGVVITYDQEDNLDGISLIPAWKWFQNSVVFV